MEYLNKELNEAIEKAVIAKIEKQPLRKKLTIKEMLNEMDRNRPDPDRYNSRYWPKQLED